MDQETVVLQQQYHCLNALERQALGQLIKEANVPNGLVCSS